MAKIANKTVPAETLLKAEAQSFDTIAGHKEAKQYLMRAVESDSLPHAMLIHGAKGVGRTSMCYALVRYILKHYVESKQGSSMKWYDDVSRRITSGVSVDLQVIEPRGPSRQITLNGWRPGKDDPDEWQYYRFVEVRPIECPRKFLIFRQAERMNLALANFLLKLIEEPPDWLTIILLTDRQSDILPTIKSRCAMVQLSPLKKDEMAQFVYGNLGLDMSPDKLEKILHYAEGRPGRLCEALKSSQTGSQLALANLMLFFQKEGFLSLFRVASDLIRLCEADIPESDRANTTAIESALAFLQGWMRDAYICKLLGADSAYPLLLNKETATQLTEFAHDATLFGLSEAMKHLDSASAFAYRQTDSAYVLETLLLEIGKSLKKTS